MAIALQGTPSLYESASSTTAVVPYPSGITAGEVLLAHIGFSASTVPTAVPSGWTQAITHDGGSNIQCGVYYRVADGTESGSVTFTSTGSNGRTTGIMERWSGVDNTTPLDVTPAGAQQFGLQVTAPSLTTVTDAAVLTTTVMVFAATAADINTASGYTKISGATGTGRRTAAFYKDLPTAGATGTQVWTQTSATNLEMLAVVVALRPSASTPITLSPSAIASAEALGSPTVTAVLDTAPAAMDSAETHGSHTVSTTLTSSPSGTASEEVFGTATVGGLLTTEPSGIVSDEAFGTPAAAHILTMSPAAIDSAEALDSPVLSTTLTVVPDPLGTAEAVGNPAVTINITASPDGIGTAETFGAPVLDIPIQIAPEAIDSTGAFGQPVLEHVEPIQMFPTAIPGAGAFGTPVLTARVTASPAGITSREAFGNPTRSSLLVIRAADTLPQAAFGTPVLKHSRTLVPVPITSEQSVGTPAMMLVLTVSPAGIESLQGTFGHPKLSGSLLHFDNDIVGTLAPRRKSGKLEAPLADGRAEGIRHGGLQR